MIISLNDHVLVEQVNELINELKNQGVNVYETQGKTYHNLLLIGDTTQIDKESLSKSPVVKCVSYMTTPFKLASRAFHQEDTVIDVNGIRIGGQKNIVVIGGPCSVEGEEHVCELAKKIKDSGAKMLRGGAYKPRTSPYEFQGLETDAIKAMAKARSLTGLPVVSELVDSSQIEEFEKYVDIIQIGARNMQNYSLLKEVGKRTTKPILLKRGFSNTIEEWIMSAEYIMVNGNDKIILCERGIRTFEKYTRNTLDLSVVPIIKELTHLPIIIDPSHATGNWKYIESQSLASIAAGADGLMIEVHDDPECALSDGMQSLKSDKFAELIKKARLVAQAVGRDI